MICDDEIYAINILNNENVETEAKSAYIGVLSTAVQDVTSIKTSALWELLLQKGLIYFSEFNLVSVFTERGISTALIEFINSSLHEIDLSSVVDDFGIKAAISLLDSIVTCNAINTNKYKEMLTSLGCSCEEFDVEGVPDNKMNVLIDKNIITMNVSTLAFIRQSYASHIYSFINHNLDMYLETLNTEIFVLEEALELLSWQFEDEKKVDMLSHTDESISVINSHYSDVVTAYLVSHNLDSGDKRYLFEHIASYGDKTRESIVSLAVNSVSDIVSNGFKLEDTLLSTLFEGERISRAQKIALFKNAIPNLNEETCQSHFDELGLSELKGIFTRGSGNRKFTISDEVTTIFEALKNNTWIFDYRVDERNSNKYRITKTRPHD